MSGIANCWAFSFHHMMQCSFVTRWRYVSKYNNTWTGVGEMLYLKYGSKSNVHMAISINAPKGSDIWIKKDVTRVN